jgi:hypothetical protein
VWCLVCGPAKEKPDEEKSKHVSLAQQNGLAKAVHMPEKSVMNIN